MLAAIRRTTGLPHRIVVDEAHYFLHEPNIRELLDLNLGAYTLVTYRLSDLHPEVRKAVELLMVKRITDPQEIHTLGEHGEGRTGGRNGKEGGRTVDRPGGAAARVNRSRGAVPAIRPFPPHDVPRSPQGQVHGRGTDRRANVRVHERGREPGRSASTFAEGILRVAEDVSPAGAGEARGARRLLAVDRGSVHDHLLASQMRKIEQRHKAGHERNLASSLLKAVNDRYEFSSDRVAGTGSVTAASDANHHLEPVLSVT